MASKHYRRVARVLMATIAHDCGANNCNELKAEPENQPEKHIDNIAEKAEYFFGKHPHLLGDLDEIATGEYSENEAKYGALDGYRALHDALESYFDEV